MTDQIKVTYLLKIGEPYASQAYVTDTAPHVGADKHTDLPVEVEWSDESGVWILVEGLE